MNPYVIGGIVVVVIALLALAFYSYNKGLFASAVGAKPAATSAAASDGATPTGG